jgi:hypothetical protein
MEWEDLAFWIGGFETGKLDYAKCSSALVEAWLEVGKRTRFGSGRK